MLLFYLIWLHSTINVSLSKNLVWVILGNINHASQGCVFFGQSEVLEPGGTDRGLYSTLFQEKPPEKKLLLSADF